MRYEHRMGSARGWDEQQYVAMDEVECEWALRPVEGVCRWKR